MDDTKAPKVVTCTSVRDRQGYGLKQVAEAAQTNQTAAWPSVCCETMRNSDETFHSRRP